MQKECLKHLKNMQKECLKHLKGVLKKDPSCYVLISCSQQSREGQMNVEMTYQGDIRLVAYLLHDAQGIIEDKCEEIHLDSQ